MYWILFEQQDQIWLKMILYNMKIICSKCEKLKYWCYFWLYVWNPAVCNKCSDKYFICNYINSNKGDENKKETHLKIKEVKKKIKWYPAEFTKKSRIILNNARKWSWCTACWTTELLQVHHIDKDKFNNKDSNLLVLCFYCHSKEHKHMQWKKPAKWFK